MNKQEEIAKVKDQIKSVEQSIHAIYALENPTRRDFANLRDAQAYRESRLERLRVVKEWD